MTANFDAFFLGGGGGHFDLQSISKKKIAQNAPYPRKIEKFPLANLLAVRFEPDTKNIRGISYYH